MDAPPTKSHRNCYRFTFHSYLTKTPKVRIRALPTTFEALIDASMR
jgi:hypothetical protein